MKMKEMTRVKMMLSMWTAQKRRAPYPRSMREVVLDVARHPARNVFLDHHSKTHKSPIFIQACHLSRISPAQYPNCAATIPINSGAASSFKRANATYSASPNHNHFSATPAYMAVPSVAAPATPGLNARQPNTRASGSDDQPTHQGRKAGGCAS